MDESDTNRLLTDVDLEELLLEESRRPRKNAIELDITTVVRMRTDMSQMSTLVANLLDSADRYANSVVRVGLRRLRACSVITIEDDGPGMLDDKKQVIFERFTRVDESRVRHHVQYPLKNRGGRAKV